MDKKNNKIGFAGRKTSLIYDIEDIDFFEIENVLPAKGPGYAILRANLINGSYNYIFDADTYELDPYAITLENWTHKKSRYLKRIITVKFLSYITIRNHRNQILLPLKTVENNLFLSYS
ncbi:hypothetical protein KUH03_26605 [Sphingobacterium sp. E70]|uniref:hypothetical protein n=1 Tax=Sphingobacterium sp. E70 TaxID=2853439 RepID=UPI00211D080D|nr:hypothetical protein [Sphingobacterium sp. E70]ULT22849.1 hypothetical protein KUH03_26605 [Sphingobacterium sp. E70]